MTWTQVVRKSSFTAEVVVDVDLIGTVIPAAEDDESPLGSVSYLVSGHARVNATSGTCSATTARTRCALAAALDASVVGVAIEQNGELELRLSWRNFGSEQVPSRIGVSIAEWATDAAHESSPFATTPIGEVADAFEWSGFVGSALFVDVQTGRPLRFSANIGSGFGDGLLYVVIGD